MVSEGRGGTATEKPLWTQTKSGVGRGGTQLRAEGAYIHSGPTAFALDLPSESGVLRLSPGYITVFVSKPQLSSL